MLEIACFYLGEKGIYDQSFPIVSVLLGLLALTNNSDAWLVNSIKFLSTQFVILDDLPKNKLWAHS